MSTLFDLAADYPEPIPERPGRVLNIRHDGIVTGGIYIGSAVEKLGLPDSEWRNPFRIGPDVGSDNRKAKYAAHAKAVQAYRDWLLRNPVLMAKIASLHEQDLLCWCAPFPCHGEVLRYHAFRAVRREAAQ